MSILSDTEILALINANEFQLNPLVLNCIQPSSIDLTLAKNIEIIAGNGRLDLSNPKDPHALSSLVKKEEIQEEGFELLPGTMILGYTAEELTFTSQINGRICNRNSLARWGLDTALGHYINPGFKGKMPLVIRNVGPLKLVLHAGMKICQLEVHRLEQKALREYNERHNVNKIEPAIPASWEVKLQKELENTDHSLSDYLHDRIEENRGR